MERKTINLAVFIVLLLIGIALFSLWQDGVVRERRLQAEGVFNESDESISSAQRSLKSIKGRRRNMTLAGNYSLHHLYNRIISHKRIRNTTSSSLPSLIKVTHTYINVFLKLTIFKDVSLQSRRENNRFFCESCGRELKYIH